jgi:hypothetical protein
MQRVSGPLISSPFRWNIAGATPIGIVARGAVFVLVDLGHALGPSLCFVDRGSWRSARVARLDYPPPGSIPMSFMPLLSGD